MKKILLAALAGSLMFAGCSKKEAPKLPKKHIDVAVIHSYNVPYVFDYPGTVTGVADFPVLARVNGIILNQLYKEGSRVHKGQPLYKIDPRPFENQLKADQGQLVKDSAAMQEYKSILNRYLQLYKINAVAKQDVETATINYKNALGLVQTDQANIANDKLNLQYCLVEAPVDGLISQRVVTVGSMVTAYQTTLTYINSNNNLYVNFSVPENDRLDLQSGIASGKIGVPNNYKFEVDLELADGSMLEKAGWVNFFDTRISLQNGTWNMRADVDNAKLKEKLLSGQFVHVYLIGASFNNSVAIPQAAVFRDNKGAFVYVVNHEHKIEKREIEPGMMTGQLWIINSGLKDGDKVVIDGGMKVVAGEEVIVDSETNQSKVNASRAV